MSSGSPSVLQCRLGAGLLEPVRFEGKIVLATPLNATRWELSASAISVPTVMNPSCPIAVMISILIRLPSIRILR